jgi:2-polyprenyl-3-methyl-5-hydroxy-6-metoxy-1,4-benzoquinol methylase
MVIPNLDYRMETPEWMDTAPTTEKSMAHALRFLKWMNQYFGGNAVVLKHFTQFSQNWKPNETIRILDIGCGLGDIPLALARWAAKKNFRLKITGLDLVPQIVAMAQKEVVAFPNITICQGNIFDWDAGPESYDYSTASLLLHHIANTALDPFFSKLKALTKRGMILSDLERSYSSYWGVSFMSYLLGNALVRHDGPLSVTRAFTLAELQNLAQRNQLHYLQAHKEPFFRISLSGEKNNGD